MIGDGHADASGHWTATFATKQALGGLCRRDPDQGSRTSKGGTSEVSAPKAAEADPAVPVTTPDGHGRPDSRSAAAPVKPKAPSVKITKGPKKSSKSTTAKFKFTATPAAGAKFECKLEPPSGRSAPRRRPKEAEGRQAHLPVRALASGLTGPAADYKFEVKS